jgi:hypothetical protein
MVHTAVEKGLPERARFVVGSSTPEDAEANIRSIYPSDLSIQLFALAPSGIEAERLDWRQAKLSDANDTASTARLAVYFSQVCYGILKSVIASK